MLPQTGENLIFQSRQPFFGVQDLVFQFLHSRRVQYLLEVCLLFLVASYHFEDLNNLLETTKEGVSAYKIIETLKLLGFNAQGIKCKLEELNSSSFFLPAIAHVTIDKKYEHYVVIYNINFKKKNLVIADPQSKLKKLTFEEFNQIFNNIILTMYPVKPIEKRNINPSFKNYIISIILNLKR